MVVHSFERESVWNGTTCGVKRERELSGHKANCWWEGVVGGGQFGQLEGTDPRLAAACRLADLIRQEGTASLPPAKDLLLHRFPWWCPARSL